MTLEIRVNGDVRVRCQGIHPDSGSDVVADAISDAKAGDVVDMHIELEPMDFPEPSAPSEAP